MKREIIEFWRAVEMFSPPAIPAPRPSEWVFDVKPGEPLPWEKGHRLHREVRLKKTQTWRHTVYLGLYPREEVFAALKEVFPTPPDSYDERPAGSSALLGLAVSDEGKLVGGSVVLSACAWATARALDPGPKSAAWLDGFDACEGGLASALYDAYLPIIEGVPYPVDIDWPALGDCQGRAAAALKIGRALAAKGVRVRSDIVARRTAESVDHDFLNSFIAGDLARVAHAAGQRDLGAALAGYLRAEAEIDVDARIDVQAELDAVRAATDPGTVPLGRWPSGADRPLALGQQLAVNEAGSMPAAGGHLFAVNGPPGTGKTTMLRDLIAALVTERAKHLAALSDPAEAFVGDPERWKTSRYQRVVRRLRPELTGFEIVVASSNNGAVENVTLELPAAEAIASAWAPVAQQLDYFPELARQATKAESWALVAARLGNSSNRKEFVNSVWWPERQEGDGKRAPSPAGLRQLLKEWEKRPEGPSWAEAVMAFEQARARESAIRDDRVAMSAVLSRLAELEPEVEELRATERAAAERIATSGPRREQLTGALATRGSERQRRVEAREEERRRRPFFLRFGARAAWRERDAELASEIASLDALLDEIGAELREIEGLVRIHEEAEAAVVDVERAIAECRQFLARYRERAGAKLPDAGWLGDRESRERQAPWTDEEWNEARTELFIAALGLHRALLVHAARPVREALDGAMDVLSGQAPSDLSAEAALAAWQALFLLVPVVSTTFASVPRIFRPLGREALGWLLVDEAGQATPQNAVGAMWRCRRAVIVGDPLQLEPITTIPFPLEQAIRKHYGVDEEWLTGRSSVQVLADRQNRFGTTLPGAEKMVWVGAPLSVHRRCDQPMFGISNEIAYGGLMVEATDPALAEAFDARFPTLPSSRWINVRSGDSQGHWIPAEGVELDRILTALGKLECDFGQVMAIGPFRDVARRLAARARKHPGLRAGTIHTAQGKEADIVILVLGSDPARDGARAWAASRPNLLNVAVSRARRRLYVIGNRDLWMEDRYFDLLADRLPHGPPRS